MKQFRCVIRILSHKHKCCKILRDIVADTKMAGNIEGVSYLSSISWDLRTNSLCLRVYREDDKNIYMDLFLIITQFALTIEYHTYYVLVNTSHRESSWFLKCLIWVNSANHSYPSRFRLNSVNGVGRVLLSLLKSCFW